MRILKRIGTVLLFAVIALCLAPTLIPPFLDRIYYEGPRSDHFDGERFFNPGATGTETAAQAGGRRGFLRRFLSGDRARWPDRVAVTPTVPPPRVDGNEMRVTWIGHATVLIQTRGLNILTDPFWSDRASPFPFVGPQRVRAPGVRFEDLPKIDLVLVSHNHYDHLDLPTLERLWRRDRPKIVTSLGNDAILKRAGIGAVPSHGCEEGEPVVGLDWGESTNELGCILPTADYAQQARISVDRNHHWSSRWGTDRNRALWSAFTVALPGGSIFYAGDTGWGDGSWVREAAARGPYRLAIIPIGAYEPRDFMKTNHVDPEEAVAIFDMLNPTMALGVHWGTVQLTFEPIDEPRLRLEALKRQRGIPAGRLIATEAGGTFSVPGLPAPAGRQDRRTRPATSR